MKNETKAINHAIKLSGQQYSIANKKASDILSKYNVFWVQNRVLVDLDKMSEVDSELYQELCISMEFSLNIQSVLRLI